MASEEAVEGRGTAVDDVLRAERQRAAAQTLLEACTPGNRALVMERGAAPVLAGALRDWDDAVAKECCVSAITFLASESRESQLAFAEAGVLEPLVAFLPHLGQDGASAAAEALYCLTQDNPRVSQRLRDVPGVMEALEGLNSDGVGGFVERLLEQLRALSPSGRRVKPARAVAQDGAGAAAAPSLAPSDAGANCMAGDLSRVAAAACVAAVRDAVGVEAQRESAQALHSAATACDEHRSVLLGAGVAPVLVTALREWEDAEAKARCAWVAACAMREWQVELAEAGVLEPLVAFLPQVDVWGSSPAALALHRLTKDNPDVAQRLLDVPGVIEALEVAKDRDESEWSKAVLRRLRPLSVRRVKPARAAEDDAGAAPASSASSDVAAASSAGASDAAPP